MSFTEKTSHDCLPPEAYIRLASKCKDAPRFASSYYPPKDNKLNQKPKKTK